MMPPHQQAVDYQRLPKVELHLHLDCSLSYEVARRLDRTVTEDSFASDFIAPAKCTDLADYLTRAPMGVGLMQTEPALRAVTDDLFAQLERDGVVYAEIRFAPLLHTQGGLTPRAVVAAVEDATRRAAGLTDVDARLLLCTLRHFTQEQSLETARLAAEFQGTYVVGLDLAADEAGFPIDAHVPAFQYALQHGLHRTAHAGEAAGAASVWETLERLRPTRIGHGVRSIEDPALLEHLRRERVHLEVCPTSNVQTDVVGALADHPIDRLSRAGVSVGVNTDARTISNVTLTQEYERLRQTFGWGPDRFLASNLEALAAAFIPSALKGPIEERLRSGYARVGVS